MRIKTVWAKPITEDVNRLCSTCEALGYIGAVANEYWHNTKGTAIENAICDYITELFNEKREQVQKCVNWIPASERLPEKDGRYLVYISGDYPSMEVFMWADGWNCYRRINGTVDRTNEIDWVDIIAWMPLPEPYKEQENE